MLRQIILLIVLKNAIVNPANDYKILHENLEATLHPDLFKNFKFVVYNVSGKQKFNLTVDVLEELSKSITISIRGFKLVKNVYRDFPFRYDGNACEISQENTFGIKAIFFTTNFKGCPVKKGLFSVTNVYWDENKFPPKLPRGRFLSVANMTYGNSIQLSNIKWYWKLVYD